MNTWQEDRPSGGGSSYGQGNGGYGGGGAGAEPPLPPGLNPRGPGAPSPRRPQPAAPQGGGYGAQPGYPSRPGGAPRGAGVPAQGSIPPGSIPQPGSIPPGSIPPGAVPPAPRVAPGGAANSRWPRSRKIKVTALALVGALLVTGLGTYFWADSKLNHENTLASYPGRPPAGKGTNWLIVGSDSRDGLSDAQKDAMHTGTDTGKRSDSMMILHIGDHGNTLMSVPRDSWVPIPQHLNTNGNGKTIPATTSKINSAFNNGGGQLLVQTIETNTGIHIDHYAEIGFAGFVGIVDSVGGVNMCIDKDISDQDSGLNLKAGCQSLNGTQSLAFVRQRHQMADQDLGRMRNQQKFLSALAKQAASPATLLNPFTLYPLISSGLGTLIVDNDTGLTDLGSFFLAMKGISGGSGKTVTVPVGNANYRAPDGESALKWDPVKSKEVFDAFKNDTAVPDVK
ncbi:LCP family protein [Kitasatospora sp. GP82]|uniref:LCP family protein n=1 Tax=Kitasatospora sp. GP82 TaxID=3035089 RepID=UPI002473BF90|nr:LCP family protein [Kitasatospora sp. GP82]MDH6124095.1 LCP family protein required for cell wall assembly [Kitasatospora sp. GP82]